MICKWCVAARAEVRQWPGQTKTGQVRGGAVHAAASGGRLVIAISEEPTPGGDGAVWIDEDREYEKGQDGDQ